MEKIRHSFLYFHYKFFGRQFFSMRVSVGQQVDGAILKEAKMPLWFVQGEKKDTAGE